VTSVQSPPASATSRPNRKILEPDALAKVREQLRHDGKTVVQCHGCFDIVHPGHVRYLSFAKEHGDVLIVSVSGDRAVGKGPERPYINEGLRAENLAALECVDYVCIDHHDWAGPILELLKPDLYVKGKEYENKPDPRFLKEKALVEGYGGKVVLSSGDVIYSSTFIISQFADRFRLEQDQIRAFCHRNEVDRAALETIFSAARGIRVLVLADPIVDRYVHCDALGIADESPVITVNPIREESYIGAGGLIAHQMAILGAEVSFLTMLGTDEAARQFCDSLSSRGVEPIVVRTDARPVFTKTRYLVDDRKVFKVDSGGLAPPSTAATDELIRALEARLADCDALLVTDFGYGLFSNALIDAITRGTRARRKPYYVDVSGNARGANILRFAAPRLAAPTEQELRFAFADNQAGISNLALRYYRETRAEHLVLTMGKRGALTFERASESADRLQTDFLPALSPSAADSIGAGDVFLAGLALSDLARAPLPHGVYLGSALAAIHVSRLGNEPVDGVDIHQFLDGREELTR
jgi:rfaE bifunctional protein kinase chain/domain/rfaE bifunctional protein nucleotidyltransferase chain/domain